MDIALLLALLLERMEEKTLQIVLGAMGGQQLIQIVGLEGEEEHRGVCLSLQHIRMFQVPVGDDHLPGGEGPGLAQEDLPKAPFEA